MTATSELDLTQVDGVKVVTRNKATIAVGFHDSGTTGTAQDVDEVLLEDGRVVFQCVARTGGCGKTWDSPRSVTAHLRSHQGVVAQKRVQQELQEVTAENERLKKQARENDRRRLKRDATEKPAAPVLDETTRLKRDNLLRHIDDGMSMIEQGRGMVRDGVDGLARLAVPVDPEIAAKAAKYDQMRGLLG